MSPKQRMSESVRAVAVNPWFASALGSVVIAFAGVMLYREPPDDKLHMGFWGALIVLGLAMLPGVLPFVAANLRPLLTLWKASKNGTGGPPSAPSP